MAHRTCISGLRPRASSETAASALRLGLQSSEQPRRRLARMLSVEDHFFSKVSVPSEESCWEWTAGRFNHGYGVFCASSKKRAALAHRVSYELCIGPIPEGLHVLHSCDNPPCVNPAHLSVGTNQDNCQDKVARGRSVSGPEHHQSKKTHCPQGHEYSQENTRIYAGRRYCKTCATERNRAYYLASRNKALSAKTTLSIEETN